jgi:hypothetical protein
VTLRVMPLAASAHAGPRGLFVILEFAEEAALEQPACGCLPTDADGCSAGSLAPPAMTELIASIAADLE